jgi:hypothetical protein
MGMKSEQLQRVTPMVPDGVRFLEHACHAQEHLMWCGLHHVEPAINVPGCSSVPQLTSDYKRKI